MTKKLTIICFLTAVLHHVFVLSSVAQTREITGTVQDGNGNPIPGVTVVAKNSSQGTVTDIDGQYAITVADPNATLVFSFIGYKPVESAVANRSQIDITMEEDIMGLDEVVVIGYGSVKKSDLTGSVASLKADEIAKMPVQSFDKALQGRVAGVQVRTSSAAPGGSVSVIIRGGNSINSSIQPLYVIDGIPVDEASLNSFNPDDIESMEILKDASSTAIYGSRGANGVVLITTKRGKEGKPRIQYSNYFRYEVMKEGLDLLSAREFAELFNEWSANTGRNPLYTGDNRYFPSPDQIGVGTDWIDQITRVGVAQNHQLSITGGTDKAKYALSGGYLDHDGIIMGGNFVRGTFKVNTDVEINDWLSIGNNLNISRHTTNGSGDNTNMETGGGTINAAIKMSPVLPVYDADGNYTQNNFPGAQGIENPVANAREITNRRKTDRMIGSLFANISPLEGLNLRITYGADITNGKNINVNPSTTISGALKGGTVNIGNNEVNHVINENLLTYKRTFGQHKIDLLTGYTREWNVSESSGMNAVGFPSDILEYNNIGAAEEFGVPTSWKSAWQLESYLSRLNYVFKGKYLLTFTGRYDGSSKLAEGNKWAFFPSGAFAWRISDESFIQDHLAVTSVSNMKLRVSHGLTGNSNIGLYKSQVILGIDGYPFNGAVQAAVYPQTLGNPDLGWEYTTTSNIGLDLGFFNDRISLTADVYRQTTRDLLWNRKLDPMSGYAASMTNAGELRNEGVELALFAVVMEGAFKWRFSGNISMNRNEIMSLEGEADQWKVGLPVGVFRGRQFDGIFRDWDEVYGYVGEDGAMIQPAAQPGDVRFRDVGGAFDASGNRIPDGKISGEDWVILGNPNPDFIFGISNDFSFKGFDLSVFITGSQGNAIRNTTGSYLRQVTNMRNNLDRSVLNRWTPENPDAEFMRLGGVGAMPDIEDGSYVKLQNVNLGYSIPVSGIKHIQAAKVFVSGQNLVTLTNYSGFDPDINTGGKSATNLGSDNAAYPMPRSFAMGINITF